MSDQLNLSLFNKNLVLLIIGNILFGMIMPLLIVIGGIAGYQLAPNAALATLPASLQPVAGLYLPLWFRFLWQNTGDDKD